MAALAVSALVLFVATLTHAQEASQCSTPASASQYCMGSSEPIVVGKGTLPVCIPGCTYTITDVSGGQQISVSFAATVCEQYQSFITYNGKTSSCNPGRDAKEIIPLVDGSWAQPNTVGSDARTHAPTQYVNPIIPTRETVSVSPLEMRQNDVSLQEQTSVQTADGYSPSSAVDNTALNPPESGAPSTPDLNAPIPADDGSTHAVVPPVSEATKVNRGDVGMIDTPSFNTTEQQSESGKMQSIPPTSAPVVNTISGSAPPEQPVGWVNDFWQSLLQLFGAAPAKTSMVPARYAVVAASQAISATGESATCYGGEVLLYSKDFSDMSNDPSRLAQVRQFQCYRPQYIGSTLQWVPNGGGSSLNFKEFKTLTPADACALIKASQASQCAVAYYAVVPDLSKSMIDVPDPNHIPSQLVSMPCNPAFVQRGLTVQFAGCANGENQLRSKYGQIAAKQQSSAYSGINTSVPSKPSLLDTYRSWGTPAPTLGGSSNNSGLIQTPKYFGVKFNWSL